jgi:hypothetical protein
MEEIIDLVWVGVDPIIIAWLGIEKRGRGDVCDVVVHASQRATLAYGAIKVTRRRGLLISFSGCDNGHICTLDSGGVLALHT